VHFAWPKTILFGQTGASLKDSLRTGLRWEKSRRVVGHPFKPTKTMLGADFYAGVSEMGQLTLAV